MKITTKWPFTLEPNKNFLWCSEVEPIVASYWVVKWNAILSFFSLGERKVQVIKGDFETIFVGWEEDTSYQRRFWNYFHWVRGRYKLSKEILKLFSLGERKIQVIKGDFETIFIRWKDDSSCGRLFQIDLPIWNPRWTKFCYNGSSISEVPNPS